VISACILAAIIIAILLPRWLVEREVARTLTVATPLRLLGQRDEIAPLPSVSLAPGTPLALFIKLPVPPRSGGQYEIRLRHAGGSEIRRRIAASAFDPSGTVTILVDPEELRLGERVEVRLVALGDAAGAIVFSDAFKVEGAAAGGSAGSGNRIFPAGPR
jgi:hypothetical protein